jgi:hypothetical protein
MRNPVLAIAIALVLAAPCTALAGKKNNTSSGSKQQYMEYKFTNVYTTGRQLSGSNNQIHSPTGGSPVTSPGLLGSSGGSGAGVGSKTKLPAGGAATAK